MPLSIPDCHIGTYERTTGHAPRLDEAGLSFAVWGSGYRVRALKLEYSSSVVKQSKGDVLAPPGCSSEEANEEVRKMRTAFLLGFIILGLLQILGLEPMHQDKHARDGHFPGASSQYEALQSAPSDSSWDSSQGAGEGYWNCLPHGPGSGVSADTVPPVDP